MAAEAERQAKVLVDPDVAAQAGRDDDETPRVRGVGAAGPGAAAAVPPPGREGRREGPGIGDDGRGRPTRRERVAADPPAGHAPELLPVGRRSPLREALLGESCRGSPAAVEDVFQRGGGAPGVGAAKGVLLRWPLVEAPGCGRRQRQRRALASGAGPRDGDGHVLAVEVLVGAGGGPAFAFARGAHDAPRLSLPYVHVRVLARAHHVLPLRRVRRRDLTAGVSESCLIQNYHQTLDRDVSFCSRYFNSRKA